jgi:hypothetical protein
MKRIIGIVKGKYRSYEASRKDFDFKITVEGKAKLKDETAIEYMENSLSSCLDFAQGNIEAMAKARVTQDENDDDAIDIDLQEGNPNPHKGKLEMIFRNGTWYGFGFPRRQIKFPASVEMDRTLNKQSERTIQDI